MLDQLLASNLVPDPILRMGIRKLNKERLKQEAQPSMEADTNRLHEMLQLYSKGPIAIETEAANEQHYEVPARFFELVLGDHLKYSSAYWKAGTKELSQAEHDMLELYLERAELQNGQRILELGCGWGSLSLFMAQKLPESQIIAISNSKSQGDFIRAQARSRGLKNLRVESHNINDFEPEGKFDRIVSIEMFEHMRNLKSLFQKCHSWLNPGGALFLHVFNHDRYTYLFENQDSGDWMSRYFFTGGMMPSRHLYLYLCHPLKIEKQWTLDGVHYQKTSEAWLKNMDANKKEITQIFKNVYGEDHKRWWSYWRIFFMACAEFFGTRQGKEWQVSHYLFRA